MPFALIHADKRFGTDDINVWISWIETFSHVSNVILIRSSTDWGWSSSTLRFMIPQIFSIGLKSGEFEGQSSSTLQYVLR